MARTYKNWNWHAPSVQLMRRAARDLVDDRLWAERASYRETLQDYLNQYYATGTLSDSQETALRDILNWTDAKVRPFLRPQEVVDMPSSSAPTPPPASPLPPKPQPTGVLVKEAYRALQPQGVKLWELYAAIAAGHITVVSPPTVKTYKRIDLDSAMAYFQSPAYAKPAQKTRRTAREQQPATRWTLKTWFASLLGAGSRARRSNA